MIEQRKCSDIVFLLIIVNFKRSFLVIEIWKGLIYQNINYSNLFEVSNYGNIRRIKTGKILKQILNSNGYYNIIISLGSRKNKKCFRTHRAVAETFISNPENKSQINHIDGNKLNNYDYNLEWVTQSENIKHAFNNNLIKIKIGCDNYYSKLSYDDILFIRTKYKPFDRQFGCRSLSRKFGVSHGTIEKIIHRKSYINIL